MLSSLKCVNCDEYLFQQPMQCPCGDRLCKLCFDSFKTSNSTQHINCPLCKSEILLEDCFRDRAATMELRKATLQCNSPGCSWEGPSDKYQDHNQSCQHKIIVCPYSKYGCKKVLAKSEVDIHQVKCEYKPVQCKWCKEDVMDIEIHKNGCQMAPQYCSNGCGELIPRKDVEKHMRTLCTHQVRDCDYKEDGCPFMGYGKDLNMHYLEQSGYHMQLLKQSFKKREQSLDSKIMTLTQQNSDLKSELNQVRMEISIKMQPVIDAVMKAESAIQHLQEGFSEMALMVQTLQATSYSGVFIWKIPEIQRRRHEAKIGKTVSLYSAPFYTSRHGYKVCLRLYMDGDGSGKGTHLSFFLTVMKGEYDALLQWPFKQTVTLMLLDQDKLKDVVQSFRPEPTSSSFQRPRNEMNVASGCPMFAPLSILNNSSYVKEDTMFLKCKIETTGIDVE